MKNICALQRNPGKNNGKGKDLLVHAGKLVFAAQCAM